MKKKINLSGVLINTLVLVIFALNFFIIYKYKELILSLDWLIDYMLLWLFLLSEVIIILIWINFVYLKPISELEYNIKKFIVWWFKWDEIIKIGRSSNPHIDYILLFFSKILNWLKGIKSEFFAWKAIKWEVELAEEIQWKFLNKKVIDVPHFAIKAAVKSAWEIWWDSFDVIKNNENYYIYVWDATWHWVWAWFIMVMVNSLIEAFSRVMVKWNEILANTNSILKPRLKANLLKTLLLLRYNHSEERLFMTWAGHEYLLIYKNNKKKCYKIKSGWVALWMLKNIWKFLVEREIKLEEDDIIVLYSDWITEAINLPERNWNEQMFWEDRLVEAVEKAPEIYWAWHKSASLVFNNITIALSQFMWYNHIQLDDITLVVMHYNKDKDSIEEQKLDESLLTEWSWNKK